VNIDDQTKLDALRWRCLLKHAFVMYPPSPDTEFSISLFLPVMPPQYMTAESAVDFILLRGYPESE
jgi:hypothetical protein